MTVEIHIMTGLPVERGRARDHREKSRDQIEGPYIRVLQVLRNKHESQTANGQHAQSDTGRTHHDQRSSRKLRTKENLRLGRPLHHTGAGEHEKAKHCRP